MEFQELNDPRRLEGSLQRGGKIKKALGLVDSKCSPRNYQRAVTRMGISIQGLYWKSVQTVCKQSESFYWSGRGRTKDGVGGGTPHCGGGGEKVAL